MARPEPASPPSITPQTPGNEQVVPAAYTVLARRYRPQQFHELVGQEATAQALVNALKANRVAHAYLFTGARGVGKTSTARIVAKALNCIHGPTPTPCDRCEICLSIASGEDVDVLEIDGASNNGVDQVRELRSNVQFRPSRSRYRIYIIDEVHMLTTPAFNALLKTLEEPPAHVKFILATTEVQSIPVTILSRCQRFDFPGISTAHIVKRLRQIAAAEGVSAEDEALERISRRAAGSMRDAQSLMDQLLAFGGDRLTLDQVHALLGTADDDRIAALAAAIFSRDTRRSLLLLEEAAQAGVQLGELLNQLLDYWRDLMLVNCGGPEVPGLLVSSRHRDDLVRLAQSTSLHTILAGLDILTTTKAKVRTGPLSLLLEMAVVRLCLLEELLSVSQLVQAVQQGTATDSKPNSSLTAESQLSRAVVTPPESQKKNTLTAKIPSSELELTAQTVGAAWQAVLSQLPPILAREAEKAKIPAISGPLTLVLRFAAGYNSQREYCQEPARLARIEEAFRKVTGRPWTVRIEGPAPVLMAAQAEEAGSPAPSRYRQQRTEAIQEPLVKRAIEVLGAQIIHVDEGFGSTSADRVETAEPEEV